MPLRSKRRIVDIQPAASQSSLHPLADAGIACEQRGLCSHSLGARACMLFGMPAFDDFFDQFEAAGHFSDSAAAVFAALFPSRLSRERTNDSSSRSRRMWAYSGNA